jgi:hypothetical protein
MGSATADPEAEREGRFLTDLDLHDAVIVEGERDEAYAWGRARASTRDTLLHCASDV